MPNNRSDVGQIGENLACEYLLKKGYHIIKRNYREKWDEIDIICRSKDKTLVFVEVKTMKGVGADGIAPEDNMSKTKLKKIRRACESFAGKNPGLIDEEMGWRIDLLALTINHKGCIIKHYENIV